MHILAKHYPTSLMQTRPLRWTLPAILTLIAGFHAATAEAQIDAKYLSDPSLTAQQRKEATLLWLNRYMTASDLLNKQDVEKIRGAVEKMSPSQLEKWLEQTRKLCEYIESPKWQATRRWLHSFLKVQAMYSDKEIQQLRQEIRNADADQLLAILKRIQAKHDSLTWMYQASQQSRATEVQSVNTAIARQAAAANTARSRSSSVANLPLFGSGVAKGAKPSKGYRPPAPLINSRDVARAAVWSEIWGGRGWGWGW